jgi:3-hydroxyacyl-CoA dehydrogenase
MLSPSFFRSNLSRYCSTRGLSGRLLPTKMVVPTPNKTMLETTIHVNPTKYDPTLRYFSSDTTSRSTMERIGVIGLGLMGHGIAQVAAQSATSKCIIAYEAEQKYLDAGQTRIATSIAKLVSKGKITADDGQEIQQKIVYTTDIQQLHDTDLIVEAVIENLDLKRELYAQLSNVCQPKTIFASNTSSLSITEMASFSNRPQQFVGIHFFNPVQLMKLVEIIRTEQTDPVIVDRVTKWVHDISKVPVSCNDTPGFIVNRLLVPSLMQAMAMADRNDATIADIDTSLVLGAGHPMGPLHLADYIGLDTCYFIIKGWVEKYPTEPSFFIPANLKEMVEKGHLGRKTGRGFYHWDGDKRGDAVV